MTDPISQPLTEEQLAAIEARATAATPGPWCTDSWEIYQGAEYVAGAEWIGETCRGTTSLEQDRADAEFVAAARTDVPALLAEVARLKGQLELIRALHTDSPLGPCPLCIDADAHARGDDPTIPYPCPTARLAGATDFEPPHVRAVAAAVAEQPAAEDALPAWLHRRFDRAADAPAWDRLTDADRWYWEHHAAAVRRAVARSGFKTAEGAQR